jgi:hypothetical protein
MNKLARIGAFATLPLLAGCFDFEQSLSVAPNGIVTMVTEIAVATEMMAMGFEAEGEEFCPAETDADLPPGVTMTAVESIRDENTVCTMTAVGPIDALIEAIADGGFLPTDGDEGAPAIMLVAEGGGVYTYTMITTSQGDEMAANPDDAAMMAMLVPMFEGRTMTFSVTAPRIIETNGEVDGNTVTLVIPVLEMIMEAGIEYNLTVRFGL